MTAETPLTAAQEDLLRRLDTAFLHDAGMTLRADQLRFLRDYWQAEARAAAEARVRVLREALGLARTFTVREVRPGEYRCSGCDAALDQVPFAHDAECDVLRIEALLAESPAAAKTDVEPSRLVAEWLRRPETVELMAKTLLAVGDPGCGDTDWLATAIRDALLREGGAS